MTHAYTDAGQWLSVTRLLVGPCTVTRCKTVPGDGYQAVQLAYGSRRASTRPLLGHLKPSGISQPPLLLREIRTNQETDLKVGSRISVGQVFSVGDTISVSGSTKGRGFAGVIKRWGFGGQKGIRGGQSESREPGSIGQGTSPGRVHKGKKMPGHMGNTTTTVKNLRVVAIHPENNELWVSGAVPGHRNSVITVSVLSSPGGRQ